MTSGAFKAALWVVIACQVVLLAFAVSDLLGHVHRHLAAVHVALELLVLGWAVYLLRRRRLTERSTGH